jgi:DNA-binding NarL/FixJ family response regulator
MDSGQVIRVLLVDDHPLVREGLAARLESVPDIEVVGEAGDAAEAMLRTAELRPQVVLTDIGMKGVNGIELTRALLAREPALIVLVLSMFDSADHAQQALAAGARGYVLKDSPSSEILAAIRAVASGGTYISPALAQRLFRPAAPRVLLSEREQQILVLLGQGQSRSRSRARSRSACARSKRTARASAASSTWRDRPS